MAALPKQVQESVDAANRIVAEMEAVDEEGSTVAPENTEGAEEQPAEVHGADEAGAEPDGSGETFEAQEVEAQEVAPEPASPKEDWEHKYKTLQGIFNRQLRDNEALQGDLAELRSQLEQLQQAAKQPEPTKEVAAATKLLSDDEVDDYGADLIDVMKRAAREAVQGELTELREENKRLKDAVGGVGQRQEMSERDRFWNQLGSKVENWQDLNRDPNFLEWLEQEDVYAGMPRKELLRRAYDQNDAERASRFFKGFLNETAAVSQATTQPTPQTAPSAAETKVDLATLAAPGEGAPGSADNTNTSSGRMWTEAEISSFYESARKGEFKGRDDEYRRIESQIQTAMAEGRILVQPSQ